MGIGSLVFMLPHFIAESHISSSIANSSSDNICRTVSVREQDMGLGRLSSGKLQYYIHSINTQCYNYNVFSKGKETLKIYSRICFLGKFSLCLYYFSMFI